MSTLSLRLSQSLHQRAREWAERDGVSVNQLITLALTEKLSALMTVDYLQERGRRGSRRRFRKALSRVPDVPVPESDQW